MIPSVTAVDELSGDAVKVVFVKEGDEINGELTARGFEGKVGQQALTTNDEAVLMVGLGKEDLDTTSARKAGAVTTRGGWRVSKVGVPTGVLGSPELVQAFVEGAQLAAYQYNQYKTESKPAQIETIEIEGGDATAIARGARLAEATMLARDLINEPAATLTPRRLAELAVSIGNEKGLEITVWDEQDIAREGLGGIAGVALGSDEPARFIQLKYTAPGATQTVGLVGKGITFDSGGLSLKPSEGMLTMKTDMSGAAAVLATMSALKDLQVPVNVLGIMCCTENMPGASAQKLGDVLKMRNGTTVEVVNTDAEGRLVLGDGLAVAVEQNLDAVIDLATLTGAAVVALGSDYSCVMGTNESLLKAVQDAGTRAGEPSWPLPLPKEYRKHIDSEIADIKNLGKGREAGTIAGGMFLKEFVGDTPWAHLDIAGPSRAEADEGFVSRGGTGVGVRTLLELLRTPVPVS